MTAHPDEAGLGPALLVDLAVGFGGAESRVLDTASGLGGHPHCTLAVLDGSPLEERARQADVDVVPLGYGRGDPRIVGALRDLIRDGGFRVVDAHNVQSQLWGHLAARAEAVPVMVSTVHSEYRVENPGVKGLLHETVLRRNAAWGCRFVAVSEGIAQYVGGLAGPDASIKMVRRGFPVSVPPAKTSLRRSDLGWDENDAVVGVVGRLAPAKGHLVLLDALADLTARGQTVRCYIVGEGRMRRDLEERVRSLGLGGSVTFAGFTDDVGAVLEFVDFLCLPSLTEGLPNVLLEAVSAKVPLIVTKVGDIPRLFHDGKDALLASPGDPTNLVQAIERGVALSDKGESLAESAHRTLLQGLGHDWIEATRNAYL